MLRRKKAGCMGTCHGDTWPWACFNGGIWGVPEMLSWGSDIEVDTAEMMNWSGDISEEICGISASWCPVKGQPWTRDAIRMVFWEPSCYKEACCSGAVFQCGKFILTWEVLYTILVMWMLIARPAQTVAWKDFVWHHLMSWVIDSSVHQQTTKLSDQNTEHLKSTLPMQFYLHAEEGPWICSTFLAYPFTFSLPPASHRICRLWGLGAVTRTWKNPRTKEFFSLVFCSELRNTQRIVKQISSLPVVGKQRHGRVFYYT